MVVVRQICASGLTDFRAIVKLFVAVVVVVVKVVAVAIIAVEDPVDQCLAPC